MSQSSPSDRSTDPSLKSAKPGDADRLETGRLDTGRLDTASALPPVEPPSAGFIVQLFVIPAVIVAIIVVVWALFSWLAHTGSDPKAYVEAMKRDNESRWQAASNLADVLRAPGHEDAKRDVSLLSDLRSLLESETAAGSTDDKPLTFRVYLCYAIGEFHLADAMPPLVKAASIERNEKEREVRLAALQSIARLIPNVPESKPRESKELRDALLKAADDPSPVVRYHAAYALGVLGGPEAIAKLKSMLGDMSIDARMNAATGLARYGEADCVPELLRMIDPEETAGMDAETKPELREHKRQTIVFNGLRTIRLYVEQSKGADVKPFIAGLDKLLATNPQPDNLRLAAEDLRRELQAKSK